jgi:hypothetical protein
MSIKRLALPERYCCPGEVDSRIEWCFWRREVLVGGTEEALDTMESLGFVEKRWIWVAV